MMDDVGRVLLEVARKRLVGGYPAQVRAALDTLTDDQIWWRANATSNSVGILVLHVCGATRHFLGRGVGASDYQRDRRREFAEAGPLPRPQLRGVLEETVEETERVLGTLDPARL